MLSVLVVEQDRTMLDTLGHSLEAYGYDVRGAVTEDVAATLARNAQPDAAVVGSVAGGISGADVVRRVRSHAPRTSCIVIGRANSADMIIDAMRAGACDWLSVPVTETHVVEALQRALHGPSDVAEYEPHALTRLAEKALQFIDSPKDKVTLKAIGRYVGVSSGGLRNWCRTAAIGARQYKQFTRGLRSVYRYERTSARPENLLDLVDRRTFKRFMLLCGGTEHELPPNVEDFLSKQRLLVNPEFVAAVRNALADRVRQGDR